MREPMHKKAYKDTPHMQRDEETGKMALKKGVSGGDGEQAAANGGYAGLPVHMHQAGERREMKHRHIQEHLAMHHKHETEHAHHDHSVHGGKEKMHERHERDLKEMHNRHEHEHKAMHERHEKEYPHSGVDRHGVELSGSEGREERGAKADTGTKKVHERDKEKGSE